MTNILDLNFKISSYLKSIIGKDLITSDQVAIFELVKNSFDARATRVDIIFSENEIVICDNGKGMTYDDIQKKWLFVAYSAKRDGSEDNDYRDDLVHHGYAGSKGVGRFSCDRLGSTLILETHSKAEVNIAHSLHVEWESFEENPIDEFTNIPVRYNQLNKISFPYNINYPYGTVLRIMGLRSIWSRAKLLKLKSSLSKLINPFGKITSSFSIFMHVPNELNEDETTKIKILEKDPDNYIKVEQSIVNGEIKNFIFSDLEEKTTWLNVYVDNEKKTIISELIDRGTLIYRISEPCYYPSLLDTNFSCNLFYLNRAAKTSFTRKMGVQPVKFGSVFLFKNGFRVYPIGDEGNDEFQIDRRKQQGYARYLGTRDLLGRIDVYGNEEKFREASSRDRGLISTPAYQELQDLFNKKCLQQLESYVVGVSWKLKFDIDMSDSSFLDGDEARAKVIDVLSKLTNNPEIVIEEYSPDLLSIINNKVSGFESTISNLSKIAHKIGDLELVKRSEEAAQQYHEMQRAEAEAIAYAERERQARLNTELKQKAISLELINAQREIGKTKEKLHETVKRNLFLTSLQSRGDRSTLESLHHQVIIYASNAINLIEGFLMQLKLNETTPTKEQLVEHHESLLLLSQQIIAASKFATSADFEMRSSEINEDLSNYIDQYISRVCAIHRKRIEFRVVNNSDGFLMAFKPIEFSIIIDNLINNAEKAGADKIDIVINKSANVLSIFFHDNGFGISDKIENKDDIFLKGVTTTFGTGLGLFHVKQLLQNMRSSISIVKTSNSGTTFEIKVYK